MHKGMAMTHGKTQDSSGVRASYTLLLIFLFLAGGILTTGYLYFQAHEKQYLRKAGQELTIIKDMKVSELTQWRKERMDDAAILFRNSSFSKLVIRYFNNPEDHDARKQLLEWMSKFQGRNEFNNIRLLDIHGFTRLSVPGNLTPATPGELKDISEVIRSGQPSITDFYRSGNDQGIYLAVQIPILNEELGHALGILSLRLDPKEYLYPSIQHWPTPSSTGETLLIRREGDEVVYLNELRHRRDTAFSLRLLLSRKDLPAAMAVLGTTGIVEGIDYRGVSVMASIGVIPDSPWFLVSKIDNDEIYAPIRERLWIVVIFVVLLLLGSGLGVGLVWRQQRLRFYKERYKITEALRVSEANYRVLFREMLSGFARNEIICDSHGRPINSRYLEINPAFERITGLKAEEVVGRTILEVFPSLEPSWIEIFGRVALTGESIHFEKIASALGIWFDVMAFCPAPNQYACTFTDITERKRAEKELEQKNRELEQMVYVSSHDLRAPLVNISGYSGRLARLYEKIETLLGAMQIPEELRKDLSSCSAEMAESLDYVQSSVIKMEKLLKGLLDFSRSGKVEIKTERLDMNDLIARVFETYSSVMNESGIIKEVSDLPECTGDKLQISQAFSNLIGNAIKFLDPARKGIIKVSGRREGRESVYCIEDNGIGIAPEHQKKIFDVFYQLATSAGGEGLGLSIIHRIMERHGGKVWLESEAGKGSKFFVQLPGTMK
ncbi:MAG: PAS domain S-box protein [Nitrospirae bacterium]|nr:PAS domain S-box protein [Nitrospirota bacterium]